jgi:hypothetical protein
MKHFVVALSLTVVASSAGAVEYLGLDLGAATKDKIVQQLINPAIKYRI